MGTYTANYGLFKAADGDFVDVDRDINANMNIIDELLFEQCQLPTSGTQFSLQSVPVYKNKHLYCAWDGGVRVWDNAAHDNTGAINFWQPTHASPVDWTPLAPFLYPGWVEVPGFKTYYRFAKEETDTTGFYANYKHMEFRGRVSLGAGYNPIVQNTVYQITNPVPNLNVPTAINNNFGPVAVAAMGNSPASATIWNRATIYLGGQFNTGGSYLAGIRKCGTNAVNAQTPGNTENYISLDGVTLLTTFDGTG